MIDKRTYFKQIEDIVKGSRNFDDEFCRSFYDLSNEYRHVFVNLLNFLGCKEVGIRDESEGKAVAEEDRITAVRLMLLDLYVDTGDPRWSSFVMERFVEVVMKTPGGRLRDLFQPLYVMLGDIPDLSESLAHFIKDIVILSFSTYRPSFEAIGFDSIILDRERRLTKPQAYLLLFSLPEEILNRLKDDILESLANTPFLSEAEQMLDDT